MNTKRFRQIILGGCATFVSVALCACSADQSSQLSTSATSSLSSSLPKGISEITTFTLPYTYTDSFNPYTAQSVNNLTIMPLLYDSLVKINPDYGLDLCIAKDYTVSESQVTFNLRDDITFSDESPLSAKDVVYSLNTAKKSGYYAERLASVASVSGSDSQVFVSLSSPNCLAAYLLDVPIIKQNSDSGSNAVPIGCGRYVLQEDGAKKQLNYNQNHFLKSPPKFSQIQLAYSPNTETTEAGIKIGTLSIAYRGASENTMGGTGAESESTPLTQLLYIGFNGNSAPTSDARVRKAISAVLNRKEIVRAVYANSGIAAALPLYPKMDIASSYTVSSDLTKANSLLDQAGYTQRDQYGSRLLNDQPFTMDLLVPQSSPYKLVAANSITAMLHQCGISVNTISVDDETYTSRIAKGDFTMYIGELLQQADCSINMFLAGGSVSGGLAQSDELTNAYNAFLNDKSQFPSFASLFNDQLPFAPLCYRNGVFVHNKSLNSNIIPSASDLFYNISDWK